MTLARGLHVQAQANPTLVKGTASNDTSNLAQNSSVLDIVSTLGSPAQVNSSVTLVHTHITVTSSSATALAANSAATYRLFQNIDATNTITIAFSVVAVDSQDIVIQPKSQIAFNISMGNLDTRVVHCIAATGSPVLCITEGH